MNSHPLSQQREQRGIALVVVLVFLVLLSIFIIGFFSSSQDELTAAQSFTGEVSAAHLAESAVAIVMGQIREGTARPNAAWASQPGMIRAYRDPKTGDASSKADAFFKLYSSDDMIVSGSEIATFDPKEEVKEGPSVGWNHQPALWTNLNEAVVTAGVDPDPAQTNSTASGLAHYPILDPSLDKRVEGLEFPNSNKGDDSLLKARMPVRWMYVLKDGTLTIPNTSEADGTRALWTTATGRAPTASNPIVGRVAFWTDDETSKVNVNTAGGYTTKAATKGFGPDAKAPGPTDGGRPLRDLKGRAVNEDDYAGSYWDQPRTFTMFDHGELDESELVGNANIMYRGGLSVSQPVRGEYNRYPGHPATTSLGVLFRGLPTSAKMTMQDAPYTFTSGQLSLLTPRLQFSTDPPAFTERSSNFGTDRLIAKFNDAPGPRVKRLYANVDEVFFAQPDPGGAVKTERTQNDVYLEPSRQADDPRSAVSPELLEKMRFFLTAYSRAPELNLYGRPRVTMWPVFSVAQQSDESDWWNASDRLLAFCSTIGPAADKLSGDEQKVKRFLFQRQHLDLTTNMSSGCYDATTDINLQRNQDLVRYLQQLTSKPFPGFGGDSFEKKYQRTEFGGDQYGRDQILVEIFDYIRTVNMRDSTRDKSIAKLDANGIAIIDNPAKQIPELEKYKYAPRGLVVPARIGGSVSSTKSRVGIGRFPTISEASIVLYHAGYLGSDGKRYFLAFPKVDPQNANAKVWQVRDNATGNPVVKNSADVLAVKHLVRAFAVFETFNPMQGFAPTKTAHANSPEKRLLVMEVTGLDSFAIMAPTPQANRPDKSVDPNLPDSGPYPLRMPGQGWHSYDYYSVSGSRNSGGSEGFMHTVYNQNSDRVTDTSWYPFQSFDASNTVPDPWIRGTSQPWGIEVPLDAQKLALIGGDITYMVKFGKPTGSKSDTNNTGALQPLRTVVLKFPGTTARPIRVPMVKDYVWYDVSDQGKSVYAGADPALDPNAYGAAPSASNASAGGFLLSGNQYWGGQYSINNTRPSSFTPKMVKVFAGRLAWVQNGDNTDNSGKNPPGANFTNRWRNVLQPGDVVRSVIYGAPGNGNGTLGDIRSACLKTGNDADAIFKEHPEYENEALMHAQSLRTGAGGIYYSGKRLYGNGTTVNATSEPADTRFGDIVALPNNSHYPADQAADLPVTISRTGVIRNDSQPGDFDTGLGNLGDGPFCNKADEGNLALRDEIQEYVPVGLDQLGPQGQKPPGYYRPYNPKHWKFQYPYFTWVYDETYETFYTPNRQIPSAVLFGSLPTGKDTNWQTLAFSPNPASQGAGNDNHPGRKIFPKDQLWLDLFTMPIVEPYAISEPFSTAGKINMNYQIVPFTNIKRSSGMRAALQPVRVTGFPTSEVNSSNLLTYKTGTTGTDGKVGPVRKGNVATGPYANYRYLVDRDETLKAFDAYFDAYSTGVINSNQDDDPSNSSKHDKGIFKSAAQICDFYLYPREKDSDSGEWKLPGGAWVRNDTTLKRWWRFSSGDQRLTGDNVREKPYADLYARLTTKSNTYCVHVRAQALRQAGQIGTGGARDFAVWSETSDRVIGEYRGYSIVERYIDPQDERFTPSTDKTKPYINADVASLDVAYRFRILNTKRFNP